MNQPLQIAIIDDHEENAAANVARVKEGLVRSQVTANVIPLSSEAKQQIIASIEQIDEGWEFKLENKTSFPALENIDILFIDYQLGALQKHSWLTAEDMAGWIRTFSEVPLIIILNRFYDVDFDLTMSQGSIPTAADFHMNASCLDSVGLWLLPSWDSSATKENFRPWSWPLLQEAVADIRACRAELSEVAEWSNKSVLEHFGFGESLAMQMTHNALGFLDPNSKTPQDATFGNLFTNGRLGVPQKLKQEILKNIALDDMQNAAIKILVSSLRRWLASMILGPQDVLIDAPHLAQRMPWLLGERSAEMVTWNNTVKLKHKDLFPAEVSKFLYKHGLWLSRDAYIMPELQADMEVISYYDKYPNAENSKFCFLEDFSAFAVEDEAESFTSGFNSIWSTRFVSKVAVEKGEIHYAPKVRLV